MLLHLATLIVSPLLGRVLVSERVVAEDEVEPRPELGLLRHDPLERGARVRVL